MTLKIFYEERFSSLAKDLNSENQETKYTACFEVLGINFADFVKQTKEIKETILSKQFKIKQLWAHPDRNQNEKKIADEISGLISEARLILEDAIKKNVNFRSANQEQKMEPEYGYSLGNSVDEMNQYDFASMARAFHLRFLVNKELKVENVYGNSHFNSSSPTRTVSVVSQNWYTGPQAFKILFLAGSVPGRFKQYHLDHVALNIDHFIRDTKETINANQANDFYDLIRCSLQDYRFILFSDSYGLIRRAIAATKHNIIQIGNNATEVFLYYLKEHPETLYPRRIEKFFEEITEERGSEEMGTYRPADKGRFEQFANRLTAEIPDSLLRVDDKVLLKLIKYSKIILKYAFENNTIAMSLPSHSIWSESDESSYWSEAANLLLNESKISNPEERELLLLLLRGNNDLFAVIERHIASSLYDTVLNNEFIPSWLKQNLKLFLNKPKEEKEIGAIASRNEVVVFYNRQYDNITPDQFIRNALTKGDHQKLSKIGTQSLLQQIDWLQGCFKYDIAKIIYQRNPAAAAKLARDYLISCKDQLIDLSQSDDEICHQLFVVHESHFNKRNVDEKRASIERRIRELDDAFLAYVKDDSIVDRYFEFLQEYSLLQEKQHFFSQKEKMFEFLQTQFEHVVLGRQDLLVKSSYDEELKWIEASSKIKLRHVVFKVIGERFHKKSSAVYNMAEFLKAKLSRLLGSDYYPTPAGSGCWTGEAIDRHLQMLSPLNTVQDVKSAYIRLGVHDELYESDLQIFQKKIAEKTKEKEKKCSALTRLFLKEFKQQYLVSYQSSFFNQRDELWESVQNSTVTLPMIFDHIKRKLSVKGLEKCRAHKILEVLYSDLCGDNCKFFDNLVTQNLKEHVLPVLRDFFEGIKPMQGSLLLPPESLPALIEAKSEIQIGTTLPSSSDSRKLLEDSRKALKNDHRLEESSQQQNQQHQESKPIFTNLRQNTGLGATLGLALGVYLFPIASPAVLLVLVCAGLIAGSIKSCGTQSTSIVANRLGISPQRSRFPTAAPSTQNRTGIASASAAAPVAPAVSTTSDAYTVRP